MKHNKYFFALLILIAILVSGCKDTDIVNEHHFDNKLYMTSSTITDDLLIEANVTETSREISYRIALPADMDIQINFDAAPSMTATYNLIYGDSAVVLPLDNYDIPAKMTMIKSGDISSDNVIVNFKNTNQLDNSRRYVLPVTIQDVFYVKSSSERNTLPNIGVLDNKRTVYFIFKGAALINVVANIKETHFPINWKSDVSKLPTITVEALLRSEDWVAGRENPLSSVFGIEGTFLVRIGDGDRPRDQLQVAASDYGGNFHLRMQYPDCL